MTDVIQGLQLFLNLATRPGDGIILQEPNYRPFRSAVPTMGRRPVHLHVLPDHDSWRMDVERLENDLSIQPARVLLLVNPHNPTGRVWRRDELQVLANLAERRDLLVISDEIHSDLVYTPAAHIPFASLGPDVEARKVTLTSATKAFNIAGLRTAVAHIGPSWLRERWDAEPPDLYGVAGVLGVEATRAAWTEGDPWLAGAMNQLRRNRDQLVAGLSDLDGLLCRPRRPPTSPGSTAPDPYPTPTPLRTCASVHTSTRAPVLTTAATRPGRESISPPRAPSWTTSFGE